MKLLNYKYCVEHLHIKYSSHKPLYTHKKKQKTKNTRRNVSSLSSGSDHLTRLSVHLFTCRWTRKDPRGLEAVSLGNRAQKTGVSAPRIKNNSATVVFVLVMLFYWKKSYSDSLKLIISIP